MRNRFIRIFTCITAILSLGGAGILTNTIPISTVSAATNFTFKGSMSKEVLRNYASRAVTSWIVLENNDEDPIFEEDLRMTLRIGAKYLGRAASFSWGGDMSKAQVDKHFKVAAEKAAIIHKADPEIILQGGVFEIAYKATVNNTPIPSWVFEAFGLTPESRNFKYENVVFPEGHEMGPGFWGTGKNSAVPNIRNVEAQMYFYYNICRYIDAGFEAIHIGQAEKMMEYKNTNNAVEWDKVTSLARAYAKTHARRGVVLIDGHSAADSPGMKVGNRLILDIQAAALVPNETKKENGAMKCEVIDYRKNWLSWFGRSGGGEHPLGFTIENNITILEFDNYGGNGKPGVATPQAFYVWGYDDITWFAMQPEWYRNQFLKETNEHFKTNNLDSAGKQVYFLQPCLRRVLTSNQTMTYTPGKNYNVDFVFDYFSAEKTKYTYNQSSNSYSLTITKDYRANRQSDGCPNGSGQEDTIREIFLGAGAAENPELLKVVLPAAYQNSGSNDDSSTGKPTGSSSSKTSSVSSSVSTSSSSDTTNISSNNDAESSQITSDLGGTSSHASGGSDKKQGGSILGWILAIIGVLIAGGGAASYFLYFKKKNA